MQPDQQPANNNEDLLKAINGLKDDIVSEMDTRFAAYDEKLGKVDNVEQILTEAQKNQQAAVERQRQEAAKQAAGNYQPQTWEQVRQDAARDALEVMKREQATQEEKVRQDRELSQREERELDAQLDNDMAKLEKAGYLPPAHNPNDYNDPGVAARRELLTRAAYLGTPDLEKVADDLTMAHKNNQIWSAEKQAWESAENTTHPLPGKFAPVGNSSVNSSSNSFAGPTAAEIRRMSMAELAALAPQRGYGPVPVSARGDVNF